MPTPDTRAALVERLRKHGMISAIYPQLSTTAADCMAAADLLARSAPEERGEGDELARLRAIIERDRSEVADVRRSILRVLGGYDWLSHTRGSYAWDDDRWYEEFGRAWEAVRSAAAPLERIAFDLSDCPGTQAEARAARSIPREPAPEERESGLAALVLSDVVRALWTLPGFGHSEGNSVAEDVLDYARRLATPEERGEGTDAGFAHRTAAPAPAVAQGAEESGDGEVADLLLDYLSDWSSSFGLLIMNVGKEEGFPRTIQGGIGWDTLCVGPNESAREALLDSALHDGSDDLQRELRAALASRPVDGERGGIYVASKTKHADKWLALREQGYPIISTWIDESKPYATIDWTELWDRCTREASRAAAFVLYAETGDVLRGALRELGAASAHGVPVIFVGDPEALGNVARDRRILYSPSLSSAMEMALAYTSPHAPADSPVGTESGDSSTAETAPELGASTPAVAQGEEPQCKHGVRRGEDCGLCDLGNGFETDARAPTNWNPLTGPLHPDTDAEVGFAHRTAAPAPAVAQGAEEPYDQIMNDLRRAVEFGDRLADPYAVHRAFEEAQRRVSALARPVAGSEERDLLAVMEEEHWTVRSIDVPTGGGDSEAAWEVVEHYMAEPHDRVVASGKSPRSAIIAALRGQEAEGE